MLLTGQPDLDDKILHYVLVAVTVLVYHFCKSFLEWLGNKEFSLVRRLLFRKAKSHAKDSTVPVSCDDCPNRGGQTEPKS